MHAVEYPLLRASTRPTVDANDRTPFEVTDAMRELQRQKELVPHAVQRVGLETWRRLTACGPRVSHGLASRAYHKFMEIATTCVLEPAVESVHLCEAPGGFVQATGELAAPRWRWRAISLNNERRLAPRYDVLPMDRGEFLSGDVRDVVHCRDVLPARRADLVTADGAHDVDHTALERTHHPLLVAQARVAMHVLAEGGTLVLKFFEGAHLETLNLIAFLSQNFRHTSLIKPTSSTATNSERYLLGRHFEGLVDDVPDLHDLVVSGQWIEHVQHSLDILAEKQARSLQTVLERAAAAHASAPSDAEVGIRQPGVAAHGRDGDEPREVAGRRLHRPLVLVDRPQV